jgi:hypothetical protein
LALIRVPKKAAMPVSALTMRPTPTSNSPKQTRFANSVAFGSTKA